MPQLLAIPAETLEGNGSERDASYLKKLPLLAAIHGTASGPEQMLKCTRNDDSYDIQNYQNEMGDGLLEQGPAVFASQLITGRIKNQYQNIMKKEIVFI